MLFFIQSSDFANKVNKNDLKWKDLGTYVTSTPNIGPILAEAHEIGVLVDDGWNYYALMLPWLPGKMVTETLYGRDDNGASYMQISVNQWDATHTITVNKMVKAGEDKTAQANILVRYR